MRFADVEVGQEVHIACDGITFPVLTVRKVSYTDDGYVRFSARSVGNNVKIDLRGFWHEEVVHV